MWTGLVFPSRLFSFFLLYRHTGGPLISLYNVFFFVAVRSGFGWLIFRSFLNKKEKSPSPVWHHPTIHTHTHCGTYQIVIDPTDSSLFVSSSSFFSFFFHCNNFCARAGLRDPILFFFRPPFAHPFFSFLADCWTAAFGLRWVGLGRLPGHVERVCLPCLSSCFDCWIVFVFPLSTRTRESSLFKLNFRFFFLASFFPFWESLVLYYCPVRHESSQDG